MLLPWTQTFSLTNCEHSAIMGNAANGNLSQWNAWSNGLNVSISITWEVSVRVTPSADWIFKLACSVNDVAIEVFTGEGTLSISPTTSDQKLDIESAMLARHSYLHQYSPIVPRIYYLSFIAYFTETISPVKLAREILSLAVNHYSRKDLNSSIQFNFPKNFYNVKNLRIETLEHINDKCLRQPCNSTTVHCDLGVLASIPFLWFSYYDVKDKG